MSPILKGSSEIQRFKHGKVIEIRNRIIFEFYTGLPLVFYASNSSIIKVHLSSIYKAHMSPTLNGSSVVRRFLCSDTIKICNGITFDFYTGLPHLYLLLGALGCNLFSVPYPDSDS